MIILACETSTLLGSVALLEDNKILAYADSLRQGSHSDVLNIFIENVLAKSGKKLSDVGLFASGIGPGSFTGIRISLNAIKTLAYCFDRSVVGINSLKNLAAQAAYSPAFSEFKNLPVTAMINAYKNMVYIATYRFQNGILTEVKAPEVVRVQNLDSYFSEKAIVCGDGYLTYEKYFSAAVRQNSVRIEEVTDEPHAKTTGLLAFQNLELKHPWNQLVPLYLRSSEAEENLQGIKYQPL